MINREREPLSDVYLTHAGARLATPVSADQARPGALSLIGADAAGDPGAGDRLADVESAAHHRDAVRGGDRAGALVCDSWRRQQAACSSVLGVRCARACIYTFMASVKLPWETLWRAVARRLRARARQGAALRRQAHPGDGIDRARGALLRAGAAAGGLRQLVRQQWPVQAAAPVLGRARASALAPARERRAVGAADAGAGQGRATAQVRRAPETRTHQAICLRQYDRIRLRRCPPSPRQGDRARGFWYRLP